MAIGTAGTTGTTTLAISSPFIGGMAGTGTDVGNISSAIWDDRQNVYPNLPLGTINTIATPAKLMPSGQFTSSGLLYIPNRGVLQCLPGDYVMVDTVVGWPILVSRASIAGGSWVHST
jgi:hypothetical protein